MKKKITKMMGILMAMVMIFSLMPGLSQVVHAAGTAQVTVIAYDISNSLEAQGGEVAIYGVSEVRGSRITCTRPVPDTTAFFAFPAAGYSFKEWRIDSLDGEILGTNTGYSVGTTVRSEDYSLPGDLTKLTVYAVFETTDVIIPSVSLTVTEPAAGASVPAHASEANHAGVSAESGANYRVVDSDWKEYIGEDEYEHTGDTEFQAGKTYRLSVRLEPEEGYRFYNDCIGEINGANATSTRYSYPRFWVYRDFTVPSSSAATYTVTLIAYDKTNGTERAGGEVAFSDSGRGTTISGNYAGNSSRTVGVYPASDYIFTGWAKGSPSGEIVSTSNPYSFTVTEEVKLYALLEKDTPKLTLDIRCSNGASGKVQYKWDNAGVYMTRVWDASGTEELTIPAGAQKLSVGAVPAEGYYINRSLSADGTGTYADGDALAEALLSVTGATFNVTDGGKTIKIEFDNHDSGITEYPVWVGGIQANSANKDDILGDGTSSAKFDPASGVLTLNNPNIKAVNEPSKTIILSTITDLTIKGTATLEHSDAVFGIGATKGLTIDGDITAKGSAYGIYIMDGLVIEGGTVLAEANSDAGIFVESGNIFIKGGDVTAKGDTGIEASMGLIEISGTGTKVKAEGSNNEGIRAAAIRITGGEVTAKNGNVGLFAWAPETDIPISITISGENTVVMADGIIAAIDAANSNIEISDGAQVTATATGAEGYGIDAFGDITISGDSTVVTADGKKSAVQAGDKIDIKDPLSIFEPADGKLDDAQRKILTSDGETATHAVIKKSTAPGGGEQTYTITWVIDGVEETETYASGEMPTHATPTKPDDAYYTYTFQKWTPAIVAVTEDATYTAVFTRTAKFTPYVPPVKPVSPFIDVAPGTTLYDDVMYLYDRGIMVGMSAHVFGPYLPLTRGMIVTILYRMEGEPDVKYGKTFSDVPDNTWYTDGVEWAASHGIVFGYGNGKYGPNDSVTREQLAAILFRYAKYKGYDVSVGENTNILSYDDVFDTSSWAIPAMQWACGSGVLEDVPVGKIRPTFPATRAEIAHAIHVFLEKVAK